jgi:hypothetical protein
MFIMSKNRTKTWCTNFDFSNEDHYNLDIFLLPSVSHAASIQAVPQWIFSPAGAQTL